MLRSKGLTDKVIILGLDGMDPRFSKAMVDEGKMPNLKKLIEMGSAREDLKMLGAMPTITPPLWATLATGCYPMTHGIIDYNIQVPGELDITQEAFMSKFLKTEPLWNITAHAGKKTLVWHWPGGAWPPTIDSENLMVVDGTSPGALGGFNMKADEEYVVIATTKTEKGGCRAYAGKSSHIDGDISEQKAFESYMHMEYKDPRIIEFYKNEFVNGLEFQGFVPEMFSVHSSMSIGGNSMDQLADRAIHLSMSPITEPEGWVNAPEGAKEFTIYLKWGHIQRPALILKNAEGKYDKVAVYASKEMEEPMYVLDEDVYTENCYEMIPNNKGKLVKAARNIRVLEIAEDGNYLRMWVSCAIDAETSDIWYPRWIFDEVVERFGPPPATSMAGMQDRDLIMKCGQVQWAQSAKWQADAMQHMIDEHNVEVIFSHFHGPDLSGHAYMKYLKNRENSVYDESEVRKWHEETYRWSDEYIGSFIPYIDKGWTIIVTSDHSLICPEEDHIELGDNTGINVGIMQELGYTVLQKDENGNDIPKIDWEKTRAVQTRANSIYVNLKGRDRYGIVDPADKYELEEQIITDLYGYKDPKTGKRVVALALHNKDAVLLGMGGEYAADIIMMVHETWNVDHGESLSTACGHNDTSVGPIFVAAGPGIKQNYKIQGWVREVDVAPTTAVLLGVDIPEQCEGAPCYQIFTERV